jgi:hypothetical protein
LEIIRAINMSLKPILIALVAGIIAVPLPELTINLSRLQQNSSLIGFGDHSLVAQAADCIANNNLGDIADGFISRCRKGSIRQEFPGELLNETLTTIKAGNAANYKKAWKLLNDGRFLK